MAGDTPELTDVERGVLERLSASLWSYGVANDAQDHAAVEEAARLRRDAAAGIEELLREHPFVGAFLPSLLAELRGGSIETFGWSRLADVVDARLGTVRAGSIEWDRVYHLEGRASAVPDWIARLSTDHHAEAAQRLGRCLVDGERITQATPLALRHILGALRFGMIRDQAAVESLAARIAAAARAQHERLGPSREHVRLSDWRVFRSERLWPPFRSPREDEVLLAEWRQTDDEVRGWASLTLLVLDEHARFMARRASP